MNVLHIEQFQEIRDLVAVALEAELNINVIEAETIEEALEILETDASAIDLIICDYKTENESKNEESIFYINQEKKWFLPLILTGLCSLDKVKELDGFTGEDFLCTFLKKPFDLKELVTIVKSFIKVEGEAASLGSYYRISFLRLMGLGKLDCDLYMEVKDGKFDQVYQAGENLEDENLRDYSGVTQFLYIKKEESHVFLDSLIQGVIEVLKSGKGTAEESTSSQVYASNLINEKVQKLGVDAKTMELAEATIDSCVKTLENTKSLAKLSQMLLKRQDYIAELSMLTAYIVTIISKMGSDYGGEIGRKLVMAALFRDITLSSPEDAKFTTLVDEELSSEQKALIKNHPFEAAKKIRESLGFLSDLDKIIEQHHERPDGSGFPRGLEGKQIHPLSCAFIVAEDFARRIYEAKVDDEFIAGVKKEFEIMYHSSNFKKASEVLFSYFSE